MEIHDGIKPFPHDKTRTVASRISLYIINTEVPKDQTPNPGPIIFSLFINDLPLTTSHGNNWLVLADVVSQLTCGRDAWAVVEQTQEEMDEIFSWCSRNVSYNKIKKSFTFTKHKRKLLGNESQFQVSRTDNHRQFELAAAQ